MHQTANVQNVLINMLNYKNTFLTRILGVKIRVFPKACASLPFILVTCIPSMSKAFVFLNCDLGTEPETISEMRKIAGVSEAVRVSGVYDIIAKISESRENIAKLVKKIRGIASVRSSLTMIIAEDLKPVVMAV